MTLATDAYSTWVLDGGGPGSAHWAHVVAWAGPLLGWPAFTAQIIVFLTAPDGHLLSRRWRWAAWVALVGLGLAHARDADDPSRRGRGGRGLRQPGSVLAAPHGRLDARRGGTHRLRRVLGAPAATGQGEERLQLLWIASAAAMLALGVVCILAIPRIQGEEGTWLAVLPLRIGPAGGTRVRGGRGAPAPVARDRPDPQPGLGVRTRNRRGRRGIRGGRGLAGAAVGGSTEGFWPSLLATAVVALAFQPVRGRVVRIADRLAFGAAAAPYEALAEFSRRLGESPDPSALLPAVADAAGRAVNAHHVTVRLHVEGEPDETATWGAHRRRR